MQKPSGPKNLILAKRIPLNEFMRFDEEKQCWVYLNEIYAKNYEEVLRELSVINPNFMHGTPGHPKLVKCMTCGAKVMDHWLSDRYCNSCFAHLNTIAHDNGQSPIVQYLATQGVEPIVTKTDLSIDFTAHSEHPRMVAANLNIQILLGAHNQKHCLYIGDDVILINPESCEVVIYKQMVKTGQKVILALICHEEVIYDGHVLSGNFNKSALVGNVVCDNAYLGECSSINEKDSFPDKEKLNELITNPGVVGVLDIKPGKSKKKTGKWVSVGNLCPRCAKNMMDKKDIVEKKVSRFIPKEVHDQTVQEKEKLEMLVIDLRKRNRILEKTLIETICKQDISEDHKAYNK